ncbi:MAG: hypothetical protein JSS51_08235 [Planctomycetes bacterium]|nr:hypothetical protein [Planctomycetota bacterium]
MIWTAATGLRPTEFSPGQNGYFNWYALSFDGSIRFGEIVPLAGGSSWTWSGPWGTGATSWPFFFSPATDVSVPRRTLAGNGMRVIDRSAFFVDRSGFKQNLLQGNPGRGTAINFDGSVVVGVTYIPGISLGTAWIVAPGPTGPHVEMKTYPKSEFDSVSPDGAYAAGFLDAGGGDLNRRGIVWRVGAEADFFTRH